MSNTTDAATTAPTTPTVDMPGQVPGPSISPELLAGLNDLVTYYEREAAARPNDPAAAELAATTRANLTKAMAQTGQQLPEPDTRNDFERRRDDLDAYCDDLLKRDNIDPEIRAAMAQAAADVRRRHGRGS
jgi:hypothetical protein